jgi:hypothetical protein
MIESDEQKILELFIEDINKNTVSTNQEINNLSSNMQDICSVMKQIRNNIRTYHMELRIKEMIVSDLSKLKPKKLSCKLIKQINELFINRYPFEDMS